MANPIRKLVQLVLDKNAANRMESDAKKSLSTVDKGFARLKKAALALGATLAVTFGIRAIIRFGKESVRVAAESEAIWSRLAQAVKNTGREFEDVEADVKSLARAMQDVTAVGDEDFAQILTELITISGDYEQSLRNIGVVANLAAAKQIDLKTAAQLVGRAMIGETALLKRYGIVVAEGEDGVKAMAEAFRGFAEREATTLSGKLKQLNNEWADFQQALGEVMVAGTDGAGVIEMLTQTVKDLTLWVDANKETIANYGRVVIETIREIASTLEWAMGLIDPRIAGARDERQRLAELTTKAQLDAERLRLAEELRAVMEETAKLESRGRFRRLFTIGDLAELDLEREALLGMIAQVDRKTEELGETAETTGDLLGRLFGEAGRSSTGGAGGGTEDARLKETQEWLKAMREGPLAAEQGLGPANEYLKNMDLAWQNLNSEMEMSPENALRLAEAMAVAEASIQKTQDEMTILGNIAGDTAGTIVAGILGGNFSELATWKAKQNAIMAAEQLAMGLVASTNPITAPKAAAHYAAAGQFAAVSAAWGALAGVTGGFSGGGGGGGAAGSPRDVGGGPSEAGGPPGAEIHVHFVGPGFNALNPEVQRVVYGSIREAERNYGPNATVKIHRRSQG